MQILKLFERFIRSVRMHPFGYAGEIPVPEYLKKLNSELIHSLQGSTVVMNGAGRHN